MGLGGRSCWIWRVSEWVGGWAWLHHCWMLMLVLVSIDCSSSGAYYSSAILYILIDGTPPNPKLLLVHRPTSNVAACDNADD